MVDWNPATFRKLCGCAPTTGAVIGSAVSVVDVPPTGLKVTTMVIVVAVPTTAVEVIESISGEPASEVLIVTAFAGTFENSNPVERVAVYVAVWTTLSTKTPPVNAGDQDALPTVHCGLMNAFTQETLAALLPAEGAVGQPNSKFVIAVLALAGADAITDKLVANKIAAVAIEINHLNI
jgi:hypothetical protein